MRVFRPGRFPESIVRLRQMEGAFNAAGEWTPGGVNETTFRASVQPVILEDRDIEAGSGLSEKIKVFVPDEDALLAAFDGAEADQVRWRGRTYSVIESRTWTGRHCRAVCLREI